MYTTSCATLSNQWASFFRPSIWQPASFRSSLGCGKRLTQLHLQVHEEPFFRTPNYIVPFCRFPVCLVTNSENNVFEREQMVELECRLCSDGVKSPLVEFRYRRVSSKDWLRVTDQTAGFILARSSLIIRRFLDEEKGNYKCTINGTDSNPVRLRMKGSIN